MSAVFLCRCNPPSAFGIPIGGFRGGGILWGSVNKYYRGHFLTFLIVNPGTFQKIHSQEETGLPNVPAELDKLIDSL